MLRRIRRTVPALASRSGTRRCSVPDSSDRPVWTGQGWGDRGRGKGPLRWGAVGRRRHTLRHPRQLIFGPRKVTFSSSPALVQGGTTHHLNSNLCIEKSIRTRKWFPISLQWRTETWWVKSRSTILTHSRTNFVACVMRKLPASTLVRSPVKDANLFSGDFATTKPWFQSAKTTIFVSLTNETEPPAKHVV